MRAQIGCSVKADSGKRGTRLAVMTGDQGRSDSAGTCGALWTLEAGSRRPLETGTPRSGCRGRGAGGPGGHFKGKKRCAQGKGGRQRHEKNVEVANEQLGSANRGRRTPKVGAQTVGVSTGSFPGLPLRGSGPVEPRAQFIKSIR